MQGKAELRDLLLPFAVVAVVGMMIFPLPPVFLDVLLICNISIALALLVASVYLREPERFTTLPTILLLGTLFRLGLNISTTRQLLASGAAPAVITTFGDFVVGGNLVVGVVIFAIITTVQFLVIAKGAERVAEVAARFSLDAMPGKQMAIDADVRAGAIGLGEARERRLELQRESKLYGALDGAMKFVKGDSIAGILIILINIGAGLFIGVTQHGLSLSGALSTYTRFTIGDGLASQIPALLVAVAAGVAVTRVSDRELSFVGRDVFAQLGREPQALVTTGAVLALLAFVPGLPSLPLATIALLFCLLAHQQAKRREGVHEEQLQGQFQPRVTSCLVLGASSKVISQLQKEARLPAQVQSIRTKVFQKWGVIVSDLHYELREDLEGAQFWIALHGVERKAKRWDDDVDALEKRDLSKEVAVILSELIDESLPEFANDTHTRMLLDAHQGAAEDLINSVVGNTLSVTGLTCILRQLLRERVSVRELGKILQAVADHQLGIERGTFSFRAQTQGINSFSQQLQSSDVNAIKGLGEVEQLLIAVRCALSESICKEVFGVAGKMPVWLLSSELDELLVGLSVSQTAIEPVFAEALMAAVREKFLEDPSVRAILTSRFSRTFLFELLSREFADFYVLAFEEVQTREQLDIRGEIFVKRAENVSEREQHA